MNGNAAALPPPPVKFTPQSKLAGGREGSKRGDDGCESAPSAGAGTEWPEDGGEAPTPLERHE